MGGKKKWQLQRGKWSMQRVSYQNWRWRNRRPNVIWHVQCRCSCAPQAHDKQATCFLCTHTINEQQGFRITTGATCSLISLLSTLPWRSSHPAAPSLSTPGPTPAHEGLPGCWAGQHNAHTVHLPITSEPGQLQPFQACDARESHIGLTIVKGPAEIHFGPIE